MKDVIHAHAIADANWRGVDGLITGAFGRMSLVDFTCLPSSGSSYDSIIRYEESYLEELSNSVEIVRCEHCGQNHRIDYSQLGAIAVLDCMKCGASLI